MINPSLSAAGRPSAVGVLLVNLGTPDGADFWSVRRYLREFLADRRVVEAPPVVWPLFLHLVILNCRPWRSAKAYRAIWNAEQGEGPLKAITRAQAQKLAARAAAGAFGTRMPIVVDFAMRYGNPSIASRLEALQASGCDRILVAPLYPQYAAATSASVNDAAFAALDRWRAQPALRIAAPYYDDPAYIEALAGSVRAGLAQLDFEPEVILASFHGIPQAQIDKGDPYRRQCEMTSRLLREALGAPPERWQLTFQSRFGRSAAWTGPHTNAT
ncbi:MAG: ferrochelatase, partial [Methylocystis sp.]|nr:ferrochelatase [Methylocystis sp.]